MTNISNELFLERPLPSNIDAERALLGGVLLDTRLVSELFFYVQPEDFYSPTHRSIARAMRELQANGIPIDPITISEVLQRTQSIDLIGGVAAITNLTFGLPHFSSLKEYGLIVRKHAMARAVVLAINDFQRSALDTSDVVELVAKMQATLSEIVARGAPPQLNNMAAAADSVLATFESWQRGEAGHAGIGTGIPELDRHLRLKGLARGELCLIAARPSIGKTALLLQIAANAVRCAVPTLFLSLEMHRDRLVMRLLPALTQIENNQINPHLFKSAPHLGEKLVSAVSALKPLPMYFDATSNIDKLIVTVEYHVRTHGIQLLVFDYLQLIQDGGGSRYTNRDTELGRITTRLKELSLKHNIASLGAAQLNRDSEKEYRRPALADLRESGTIEQAADVVLFPWDSNAKENAKDPNRIKEVMPVELYCAKQRDGARHWTVDLIFDKAMQMFTTREMQGTWTPRPVPQQPQKPLAGSIKAPPHPSELKKEKDDDDRGKPF